MSCDTEPRPAAIMTHVHFRTRVMIAADPVLYWTEITLIFFYIDKII